MTRVLEAFERERLSYCVLRDADHLDRPGGEVDVLVDRTDVGKLDDVLGPLGFVGLRSWGHGSHRFFLAYDAASDAWLKLDVISKFAYGQRPVLGMSLTDACLKNRRYRRPVWIPSPEDELVSLLLHCVLEKRRVDPSRRDRLKVLCDEVTDTAYLSTLLAAHWSPTMTWPRLAQTIEADNWAALLSEATEVAATPLFARLGARIKKSHNDVLRRLGRVLPKCRPRSFTVALLAPDGAGKSTLAASIRESFQVPVRSIYMGLYSRGSGGKAWPRVPGTGFVSRLARQWTRFLVAGYHRAYGRVVIFDRYSYDARLAPREKRAWHGRWRQWWLAHACPAPDLVVVLDAPGEVLYERKREHSVAKLEHQRQGYLKLQAGLTDSVLVDATRDAEGVRRDVTTLIWNAYASQSRDREAGGLHAASRLAE